MKYHVIVTLLCLVGAAHPWGQDVARRVRNAQDETLQQIQQIQRFQNIQQQMQQQIQMQQHIQQMQQMVHQQQIHQQMLQMQQMAQQHVSNLKNAQCFGLTRRTRPQKVEVPILYNIKTKETAPIPRHLFSADQNIIAKMENDGWEVRTRRVCVPHIAYERVPICCPWDMECIQSGGVPTSTRSPVPSSTARPSCANGGQLIYKDGQQKCECPPGFKGTWCQAPDLIGRLRVTSSQGPFADMVREAELWRRRVFQSRQNSAMPSDPMLSPRDHLIASMAGPWAQRAAMWHQQALRQKMAEQWTQAVQGARSPYEAMLAMQRNGGNPYGVMDPRVRGQMRNPYNEMPSQGQLPPNMQSAVQAIQRGNPYSQQQVDPRIAAILRTNNERLQNGPRPPFGIRQPEARTPWDLDPFNQQVPGFMRDPRQGPQAADPRQVMATAMYQRMVPQNGPRGMGRPPMDMPGKGQETEGYPSSAPAPADNNDDGQINEEATMLQGEAPPLVQDKPLEAIQSQPVESMVGQSPGIQITGNGAGIHVSGGQMGMSQGAMPPTGQQPPMAQGPMPGQEQQMPTPEELEQIQRCQVILQPKLNECIKRSRELTLEQFMNPEYMETAKAVCGDSEVVGSCLMQLDTVCGEETIQTTRKMLNSVLQMMGLVCEQISARGGAQIPPLQGAGGVPSGGLDGMPLPGSSQEVAAESPVEQSRPPVMEDSPRQEPGPAVEEDPALFSSPSVESKPSDTVHPAKAAASSAEDTSATPTHAASQMGHDSVQRVSKELEVMGLPLWLGIGILLIAVIVTFVLFMLFCCCIRRCRSDEKEREIEKLPEPLDNGTKLYTVGIPPPSYTTTAVRMNEDGLALPPLDLDDDVSVVDEKPPLDEDADDESDEMEETGGIKKKKEKKDEN